MNTEPIKILCPVKGITELLPYPYSEIEPLLEYLESGRLPLQNLTFPRGTITPDGRLDLCKQSLGPEGCAFVVEAVWDHPHLNTILLGTDGIGNAGADKVATLIRHNPNLETIYLGCNLIEAAGAERLTDALKDNQSVTSLWLKRNPLGVEGARHIAGLLRNNKILKILDLVNTQIGPEGLSLICETLAYENRTLERIYLGGNQIGPKEASSLAEVLRHNPTLQGLMLIVNDLGEKGGLILAEGLQHNTTLRDLSIGSCGLNDLALTAIFKALAQNPEIRYLDLSFGPSTAVLGARGNQFLENATEALAKFLVETKTLTILDLSNAGIPEALQKNIAAAIVQNPGIQRVKGLKLNLNTEGNLAEAQNTFVPKSVNAIKSVYR